MTLRKIEDRPTPKEVYNIRVYMYALVAAWGAAIFGYDSAFIGGTIALKSFLDDFNLKSGTSSYNAVSANIVSTYQAGCFFGALLSYPIAERYGRRPTLIFSGAIFCCGAAIMFAAKHSLGAIYAGRIIGGLGVGSVSLAVPLYIAEISPPSIRGRLMGFYELLLQVGGVVGFWINYGVSINQPISTKQWHIPVAVQLIPGGLLFLGALFVIPESPRWIRKQGNLEKSAQGLAYIRNLPVDHIYVQQELQMMDEQFDASRAYSTYWSQMKELSVPGMRNRLGSAFLMMMFQNLTGVNAINYYSPRIFQSIGVVGTNASLFGTGIYGIVKLVVTFLWSIFLIDNVGRRKLIIIGSIGAIFSLFYVGSYLQIATHNGTKSITANAKITPGGTSAAAFIYIFAIFFSASWNGTSWVYIGEIFPNHVRTLGVSLSAANQWLWQFVVARSFPYMVSNIKAGSYFFFGACTFFGMLWAIFLMPETKGVTLEGMDELFGYEKSSATAVRAAAAQRHHSFAVDAETGANEADRDSASIEKGKDDQLEYASR